MSGKNQTIEINGTKFVFSVTGTAVFITITSPIDRQIGIAMSTEQLRSLGDVMKVLAS